jgi:hypothetical protein
MVCFVQMLSSSKNHNINGFNRLHKDFLEASVVCLVKDILNISPPLRLYFLELVVEQILSPGT